MTQELTKLRGELHSAFRELGYTTNGQTSDLLDIVFDAFTRAALTQRPAAQTEREVVAWPCSGCANHPSNTGDTEKFDRFISSLPAPQQATPAPSAVFSAWWSTQGQSMWQHVSESPAEFARRLAAHAWTEATRAAQQATPEPVAALVRTRSLRTRAEIAADGKDHFSEWGPWEPQKLSYAKAVTAPDRNTHPKLYEMEPLYTRPAAAPAVPEGFALVPVEPTPEMMEAMPSLPAIGAPGDMELKAKGWSLKAIQNRHRWLAALAAARAKEDNHA